MTSRLTFASMIAYLAVIISVVATVIVMLIYVKHPDVSNAVNISAVPGQTDVVGNMNITGQLALPCAISSTSNFSGSLVVNGGIGCNDNIHVKEGIFASYIDIKNNSMNVGTKFQTGLNLGRHGFPTELRGNQVIIECDSKIHNILPTTSNIYDFGNKDYKWRDVYVAGNIINANLFPTKPTGGIFSQTKRGVQISNISEFTTIINNDKAITSIYGTEQHFPPGSISQGDQILFEVVGNIEIEESGNNLVEFGFFLNDLLVASTEITLQNLIVPFREVFITTVKLNARNQDTVVVFIQTDCVQNRNQHIEITTVNLSEHVIWDIRAKCLLSAKIQSEIATVCKNF